MNLRKAWARGLLLGLTAYLLLIFYGISQVGTFIDGSLALEDNLQYVALPIIIALFMCTLDGITRITGLRGIVLSRLVLSIFAAIQIFITASYAYSLSDRTQMWYNLSEQWPNAWLPKYALIEIIEKRLDKIKKTLRSGSNESKKEIEILEKVLHQLENMNANRVDFTDDQFEDFIKPLELISFKPILYVCNVGEDDVISGNAYVEDVRSKVESKDSEIIIISAKIESEINELDSLEEKKIFLDDLGLEESGSNKLIRASYKLLNLHSYFTAGEKEVRGWTIKIGDSAYDAAGQIHTDFQKGFICAEVISYKDYIEYGSEIKVKEAGKMRLEGKDYVVSDGDIMHFRFNI